MSCMASLYHTFKIYEELLVKHNFSEEIVIYELIYPNEHHEHLKYNIISLF